MTVRYLGVLLRASLSRGYLKVGLTLRDGRPRTFRVHTLVAEAFLGARPEGVDINHRNGIKTDNSITNLEYISRSENNLHAHALGLARPARGTSNVRATITEAQARYILQMKGVKQQQELADEVGCTRSVVANIHSGRAWRHVH